MAFTPLSTNPGKLRKVFARLDASDESGRQVAFNVASKAISEAGLTWSDLLELHLKGAVKPEPATAPEAAATQSSAFTDIFDGIFGDFVNSTQARSPHSGARPAEPFRDANWRHKIMVTGSDLPDRVVGVIRELDRRETRTGGRMVVLQVQTDTHNYGPLVMFNEGDIDRYDANVTGLWSGWVTQPSDPSHTPRLSGIRLA